MVAQIAFGLAGGALIGALAGFFAAVIALAARRGRNDVLVRRGRPPFRDCVLPTPFVPLSAVVGGVSAAVIAALGDREVALIAALAPAVVLALTSVIAAAQQAFSRSP
ncbi:MAG TPA: hypothetical protein VGG28_16140 [Kofleriaceae bacterium]